MIPNDRKQHSKQQSYFILSYKRAVKISKRNKISSVHLRRLNTARSAYCKSKRQKLTKSSPTAISQELQMKNKMYAITTAGTRLTLILILWQSEVEKESTFWALNECKQVCKAWNTASFVLKTYPLKINFPCYMPCYFARYPLVYDSLH